MLNQGPQVLATGGGAYMHPDTRRAIAENGISIWLKAELHVLMRRVAKRDTRPLLKTGNPEATMSQLIETRYPVYAAADITVESRDEPHETIVCEILDRLAARLLQAEAASGPYPPIHARLTGSMSQNEKSSSLSAAGSSPFQHPKGARSVPVELGSRAYEVLIGPGLMPEAGTLIKKRFGTVKCGIVTDENVARHHLAMLEASFKAAGLSTQSVVLKPGEASKSFKTLAPLCEQLLEMGLERGDIVVPFGGGVIGDLAGFAAGILRRGVRFVQMPTSLLAQVDSSVGGKTGINTPQGKNLIGVFHQPSLVIADTNVLTTLPAREMRAGYAEVAKYGLLGDAAFFDWLEKNWHSVFANGGPPLAHGRGNQRQGQGRHRRPRRDGNGRPCTSQPGPHLRTRSGSVDGVLRPVVAWRRRVDRHGASVPVF